MSAVGRSAVEAVDDAVRVRRAATPQSSTPTVGTREALDGRSVLAMQRLGGNRAATALAGRAHAARRTAQRQVGPTTAVETPTPSQDAGVTETDVTDAGVTDAGVTDAGVTDAGVTDAGVTEAGAPDAGVTDAEAVPDAGASEADAVPDTEVPEAGVPDPEAPTDAGVPADAGTSARATPTPEPDGGGGAGEVAPDGGSADVVRPSELVLTEEQRLSLLEPGADPALVAEWGLPGSPERQAKVDEALAQANRFGAFTEGLAAGGAIALATTVVQSGFARYLAAKGVSQAAKAAGPAGAIISGALAVYAITREGYWDAKGEALAGWNRGEGDELWANRLHAIAEVLDVLGNVADIVAGVAGVVAAGALIIGLIPGAQAALAAVPPAGKVAFLGGIVSLVCGVLKAAAQHASRKFRERHLLTMELSDEESLRAQQVAITRTAEATYNFLGGMSAAGAIGLGTRAVRAAQKPPGTAGGPAVNPPKDPRIVARRNATPEQLGAIRAVDDAVASPGWSLKEAGAETAQTRRDTGSATANVEGAEGARSTAASDLDAASTRRAEAEGQAHAADDAHTDSRSRTAEADAAAREARERAAAELQSPDSKYQQLTDAADGHRSRSDQHEANAAQIRPQLDEAKQARSQTQAARDAAQRRVDEATATEARALEQYREMERGQMAKALADDAGRRRAAAQAEVDVLDARLREQEATAARLQLDYDVQRSLSNQQLKESARLRGEAAAEAGAQQAVLEAAQAEWHRAREAEQASSQALAEANRNAEAARAAERSAAGDARAAERNVADAHQKVNDAHAAEVASNQSPEPGRGAQAVEVTQEVAGPGVGAQTILGSGSATTPSGPGAAPSDTETEAAGQPGAGDLVIPVQTAPGAPPASSAQIDQLNVTAAAYLTAADQARAQGAEAKQEVAERQSAAGALAEMAGSVGAGTEAAEQTGSGLEQKDEQRSNLEGKTDEIGGEMSTFGEKVGELTSFAGFVSRLLGYASVLTRSIMPDTIQEAGQSLTRTGQTISQNVGETTAATQQRAAAEGGERAEQAGARATLDAARAQTPETQAATQAGVEKVEEMTTGNEELLATANESVAANEQHAAEAEAKAASTTAQAHAARAAMEQWAQGARDERHAAIDQTQQAVAEQGYEVTEVVTG